MRTKPALLAVAVMIGTAIALPGSNPAMADGDTSRQYGCAAHWRTTAAWNECQNSPGVKIRLRVDCDWQLDYSGQWRTAKGSVNPVDRFECDLRALSAANSFS